LYFVDEETERFDSFGCNSKKTYSLRPVILVFTMMYLDTKICLDTSVLRQVLVAGEEKPVHGPLRATTDPLLLRERYPFGNIHNREKYSRKK
jgi:hypothetical protein